jgi:hypothetical protein
MAREGDARGPTVPDVDVRSVEPASRSFTEDTRRVHDAVSSEERRKRWRLST